MNTYSSTALRAFAKHCPQALDYYQADAPRGDRAELDRGVAAHAILEHLAGKDMTPEQARPIADAIVSELVASGREFRGVAQPPLVLDAAIEGREIALQYVAFRGCPPAGLAEVEVWMSARGDHSPEPNGIEAPRYVALIDLVYKTEYGEEDDAVPAVVVRDYKSAWPTNASELDTVQMRGQAALAALHFPEAAVIIREVVNLRTMTAYREPLVLDEEGLETLSRWRQDILMACDACDANAGQRAARPGYGCLSCPYAEQCPDCYAAVLSDDPAVAYVTATAVRDAMAKVCQKTTKGQEQGIPVEGGVVGYESKDQRAVSDSAIDAMIGYASVAQWNEDTVKGLLMRIKPGVSQVDNYAKQLKKTDRVIYDDFIESAITHTPVARFGISKNAEAETCAGKSNR